MYRAIRDNDLGALRALITKDDVDNKDAAGLTPLVEAVAFGSAEAVRLLLDAGANVQAASDCAGVTPLHVAARSGDCTAAPRSRRTRQRQDDGWRDPALHRGGANGTSLPIVSLLLDRGAMVDEAESRGVTPLVAASGAGNLDAARVLISHGANVNARPTLGGQKTETPLMGAAFNGDIELAQMRFSKAGRVRDVDARGWHGETRSGDLWFADCSSPTSTPATHGC